MVVWSMPKSLAIADWGGAGLLLGPSVICLVGLTSFLKHPRDLLSPV